MGSIKERLTNENKTSKEDVFDDSSELDNTETN
jgi:hypothetical protein